MDSDGNEWLYVAPRPDKVTILCSKQEPTDTETEGMGKLRLHSNCKVYGARVLIQAQTVVSFNNSEKDTIPPLFLDYACCDFAGKDVKLKDSHLELTLKNAVNRLEDLRLASHKVDEVNKHIDVTSNVSFLRGSNTVT